MPMPVMPERKFLPPLPPIPTLNQAEIELACRIVQAAKQEADIYARPSSDCSALESTARMAVKTGSFIGRMPFLRTPLQALGLRGSAGVVQALGLVMVGMDAIVTWRVFHAPAASPTRKMFTALRCACSSLTAAASFLPRAGWITRIAPALAGTAFDFALKRMDARGEA